MAKKDFGSGLIDRTLAKMAGAQVDTCARYRVYEGAERSACNKIQHKIRHSALSNTPLSVPLNASPSVSSPHRDLPWAFLRSLRGKRRS